MPITDAPIDALFDHIASNLSALRLEVASLRRRLTATQAERDTLRLQVASTAGMRPGAPLGTPITAECELCHRTFIVRSNRQRVCETCRPVEHRSIEQVAAARQLDVVTPSDPAPAVPPAAAAPSEHSHLAARRCLGCGNPFRPVDRRGNGPRGGRVAQRCEPCRAERQKQIQKDWRDAKAGRTRVSAATPERVTPARVAAPAPSARPTSAQTLERYGKPQPMPAAPAPAPSVVAVVVRPEPPSVMTSPPTSATEPTKTVERRCGRCCARFKAKNTNEYFCAGCLEIRKHMKARHGRVVVPDEEPAVERTAWTGRGPIPDDRVRPNDTGMGSTLGGGQFRGKGF